jgi:hypothetical protein
MSARSEKREIATTEGIHSSNIAQLTLPCPEKTLSILATAGDGANSTTFLSSHQGKPLTAG